MEKKNPLQFIWFFFFAAVVFYNTLILLSSKNIISLLDVDASWVGTKANMLFYGVLSLSLLSAALGLFIVDRMNLNSTNENENPLFLKALLKMACAEAIGIYGLIFFVLSGLGGKSLIFGAFSLLLLLRFYPKKQTI
mgnify:FL=1